jgi:hypothetical protein
MCESMHLVEKSGRQVRWYELTHDRFIEPILSSNKVFNDEWAEKERVEKEWAEKEWAEKERRKSRNIKILKAFSIIVLTAGFATFNGQAEQRKKFVLHDLNLKSSLLLKERSQESR